MKNYLILLLAVPFILFSCQKEEPDETAPLITIERPTDAETFRRGDTVFLHALITDNVWLNRVEVRVNQTTTNDMYFGYNVTPNNSLYEVDSFWVIDAPVNMNFYFQVKAWDDSENQNTATTRNYRIQ